MKLEDLQPNAAVRGIRPDAVATVVSVQWFGSEALELTYKAPGKLRFIEVKGRVSTADTVTATRNEILYPLNKPDDFILGIVEFREDETHRVHCLRSPFQREPDC